MESFRRPGGRRVLLPAEVELCETVGITEDEYWHFVELTQVFNGKRPKEYDAIPYVVNDFVSAFFGFLVSGTAQAQFVLGLLLTGVSILLAPKPRAPKTPPSLTTAGQTGPKRFAPQTGFNSVQELATLGEVIPLIFTKQEITKTPDYIEVSGGIRVNTRLLWSQMISLGSSQQLKALFMIGLGPLSSKPDFSGYAIGDLLLKNYINKKLALYMRKIGGRPKEIHRYDEGTLPKQKDRNGSIMNDVMSVDWDAADNGSGAASDSIVSGTRTPNTQVQFGAYSPMPNSMRYRVPYELVLKQASLKEKARKDITKKRQKIRTNFPRYATIDNYDTIHENKTNQVVEKGKDVTYVIGDMDPEEQYGSDFNPWGLEDVKSAVDASREEADDAIQIGESYLIGSALAVCINKSSPLWSPKTFQSGVFRIESPGVIDIRHSDRGFLKAHKGYELLTIQKCAIGTISNSKACDVTEIGLKSRVFKQVTSFVNANSHPGAVEMKGVPQDSTDGVVKRYQDDNGSISLGPMSKYLMRYSFFRLQARVAGNNDPDADWNYIDNGVPFGVKGNSPQPQYNFIRINHYSAPQKEFEFRFIPFPGNLIKRNFVDQNKQVRMLNASGELLSYFSKPDDQEFSVFFKGQTINNLRRGDVSNTEWHLGDLPTAKEEGGKVKDLLVKSTGFFPLVTRWVEIERRSSDMDNNFKGEGRIFYGAFNGNYGSTWQWDKDGWKEDISNRNRDVNNPLSDPTTITIGDPYSQPFIDRDGFRYGVGPFITTLKGKNVTYSKRGHYYGMIKYEMQQDVNVVPILKENIGTTTDGKGEGLTVDVEIFLNPENNKFAGATFKVRDSGKNYKDKDTINILATGTSDQDFKGINGINISTDFNEFVTEPWPEGKNLNPYDAISDYYQYDSERSSHQNGPEHEIVYVNEQSDLGRAPQYGFSDDQQSLQPGQDRIRAGIANVALRLSSSKEWNSFSQFSVYIKEGIKVQRLINNTTGPTNLFPEIVYALLTDRKFGLADLVGVSSVDKERMTIAAKFCEANKFYWDGVITDKQNIREFIYQNAIFNLLDFTILGGKFSLFPSVPYNSNFEIDRTQKPKVSALFTDGNTRNLNVSFLSPEERQDFIGTVYYRKEITNGFPETLSKSLHVNSENQNVIPEKFPVEVFDMSDFCTNENHALEFLQHALMIRSKVDHGIKFETTPQAALGLQPGSYIRFISEATHTNRFENGVISDTGFVQSVGNKAITDVTIYYWKPGTQEVKELSNFTVVNGKTTNSNLHGSVFTVKQTTESNRLYKVESITYTDEGLVQVSGSHVPLLSDGTIATINYSSNDFQGF